MAVTFLDDEPSAGKGLTFLDDAPVGNGITFLDEEEPPSATQADTASSTSTTGDFFRRIGAGVTKSTADAVGGGLKIMEDLNLPGAAAVRALAAAGGPDVAAGTKQFVSDVGERAAEDYGVDRARDNTLAANIASGIGSILPTLASGPLAPLTGATMMGESARQEAEAKAAGTTKENIAFYSNAAVGALSEKLMGLPALLKSAKAANVPAKALREIVNRAAAQVTKSAAREGTQEGIEQALGNVIASEVAAYDPNRPIMQGVTDAMIAGALIGAPLGGVVQVASDVDAMRPPAAAPTPTVPPPAQPPPINPAAMELSNARIAAAEDTPPSVPLTPDTIDGLLIARNKLLQNPESNPEMIAEVNDQLLAFKPELVREAEARIAEVAVAPETAKAAAPTVAPVAGAVVQAQPEVAPLTAEAAKANEPISAPPREVTPTEQAAQPTAGQVAETSSPETLPAAGAESPASRPPSASETQLPSDIPSSAPVEAPAAPLPVNGGGKQPVSAPNPTGEKLANDLRKVGKTARDQTDVIERELGYYDEQELADLQQHLGTPDAKPSTIAQAITGKPKLQDEGGQSPYGKSEVSKEGRKDAIDELMQQEGYVGGPGAMGPREAAAMAAGGKTTGLKRRIVDTERLQRGAEPIPTPERQREEKVVQDAEDALDNDPSKASAIVSRIVDEGSKALTEQDAATLLVERQKIMNERRAWEERVANGESTEAAASHLTELENRLNRLDQAQRAAGTTWGRLGHMYQRLIRDDYTLEAMESRARVAKGGPLTPDERAKIKEQADRIAQLEKELTDLQAANTQKSRDEAAAEATKTLIKEAEAAKAEEAIGEDPKVKSLAERLIARLTSAADKARARIRERLGRASAGLDPTVLYDVSIIGAEKIAKGAVRFKRWSAEMISDLGDAIKPYLKDGWKASNDMLDKQVESVAPKEQREKVKKRVKQENIVGQRDKLVEGIKGRVEEGDSIKDLQPLVQKLALNFVRGGINERNALVDAVHGELKELVPGITRNQTRDLISGYGDFPQLDKDAAKTTLRGIKGELQQVGKIEDMLAKRAPKKTGVERRTPTDEERRLIKEVNELKKKGGFVVTDPAKQLKTAMDAIKTRLTNEIRDLDVAIATKTPIPNKKGSIQYDAEATALKAQRDALKAQYDQLFPKAPMTDAQRMAMASRALDRSIEQLTNDIASGKLYPDAPRKLTSPELEAKRAKLEQLRAERDLLRDLDTATIEQETIAALEASVAKLRDRIAKGETDVKTGKPTVDSQRVAELKAERDALNKQIADIRRGPKKTPEEIALQAFKARSLARMADMQQRLATGDFSKKQPRQIKMDAEATNIAFELNKVKTEYTKARFLDKLKQRSTGRKVFEGARDALNTARSIMTSFDVSAVLRQGGFIALGNPVRAAKSLGPMFRALASEKGQFAVNQEIQSRPNADLYKQAKLEIVDPNEVNPLKMEEAYMSRWGNIPIKIKGVDVNPVAASQRAYLTFLNKLRADSFDAMVRTLGKGGTVTIEEAKAIANYINVATGRGNLAGASGAGVTLNAAFFSPRYLVSRFELLAGQPMYGGTARTRALVAKEYGKFLIGAGVVYALAMAAGGEFEDDPRSSDFLKVKFGNTRLDPMNGLLQVAVLATRLATGEKKTLSGKVQSIRESKKSIPFGGEDGYDVATRFMRTKLSPPAGAFVDLVSGRNVIGEQVTPTQIGLRMMVPLSGGDIYKAMREQGVARGTALGLLALFGMGLQTFDENERRSGSESKERKGFAF